MRKLGRKLT